VRSWRGPSPAPCGSEMKPGKEDALGQENRSAPEQDHRGFRGPGRRLQAEEQIGDGKRKHLESQALSQRATRHAWANLGPTRA
jgi:hypothetical protein